MAIRTQESRATNIRIQVKSIPGWPLRHPDRINDDGNDGDDVDNDDDTTMMMTMMIFAVPTFKGSILLSINFKIIKHRYII